jgi:Sulfatase
MSIHLPSFVLLIAETHVTRNLIARVLAFAAAILCAITATGHAQPPSVPPNIVIILADDLGYGDIGAFNPGSRIPTPTVDKIAREGMRFTDAHTNSSVCTPTRYGLLTGRYAWRTRLQRGVLWGEGAPLVEPGRLTLASMLKARGHGPRIDMMTKRFRGDKFPMPNSRRSWSSWMSRPRNMSNVG